MSTKPGERLWHTAFALQMCSSACCVYLCGAVVRRSWQLRCKRLRDEVREMRARLEEADSRAARWAQRASMAETPLRADAGVVLSPLATCMEVVRRSVLSITLAALAMRDIAVLAEQRNMRTAGLGRASTARAP